MTREEVYKELEQADAYFRSSFDAMYGTVACEIFRSWVDAIEQALALLKAQEARVMTWEEAQANVNEGPFIIMEVRDSTGSELDFGVLVDDSYEISEGSLLTVCDFGLLKDDYGKRFRCWTFRPTDEQREATPWMT